MKIEKVQKLIDDATKEIDLAIKNGEDYDKIYEKSVYIDNIINEYFATKTNLENEKSNLITKYNNLIETSFKNKVIGQIRAEVRKKYPSMGIRELLLFSTNVYIYAILIVHNVKEQETVNQLIFLNNKFFNAMQNENDIIINRKMKQSTLQYLTYIKDKYIEIIKERI